MPRVELALMALMALQFTDVPVQAFAPALGKWSHQWRRTEGGKATGCQSPSGLRRRPAQGAVMMADDNKDPQNEKKPDNGLMDKLLSPFEAPDSGEGTSPLERAGNYVFDLITVTVGAAVFTCLALNFMGKVPCI